jgi:hypothetical protein
MMEFNELFRVPLKLLKYLGFLPYYESSIKGKIWHGYAIFTYLLIFVNSSFQAHSFIKSFENLDKFIDNIGIFTQTTFLITKLMSFYLQREKFHWLMKRLIELIDESEKLIWNLFKRVTSDLTFRTP